MKFHQPIIPFILLIGLMVYISCRKIDRQPESPAVITNEKFFNSNRSSDPFESILVNFIKRENDKQHFVDRTIKQIGYPYWNKAIKKNARSRHGRSASDSAIVIYIPFARESEDRVNASMVVHIEPGDTTFSYLCDWQYSSLYNTTTSISDTAEQYAAFFMMLDKTVFGHQKFNITDSSLFKINNHRAYYVTLSGSSATTGNDLLTPITVCEDVTVYFFDECPYPNSQECSNGCDYCILCMDHFSYDYCWEEYVDDGSGGGNPGPGNGGGGGGGGTPPQCPGGTARTEQTTDPCLPGWEPDSGGGGSTYNPNAGAAVFNNETVLARDQQKINTWRNNNLDTAGLDSCRMLILNKLINTLSGSSLGVFLSKLDNAVGAPSTVDKFKIHFLTRPLQNYTALTHNATYDDITKEFEVDISLDSAVAQNATDIFIAMSLLHEVVHAYMTFIWKKLNMGATPQQMDSLKYDQVFNAYVDTLRIKDSLNPHVPLNAESIQHNYMADQLLDYFVKILKQAMNNPAISDRYLWYLAWSGLTRKQVKTWKEHWPNHPNWPPSNPAPTDASTRGLKYALTTTRIDSIYNKVLNNEEKSLPGALGRKPVPGGCY